jgi:hypothetical protein
VGLVADEPEGTEVLGDSAYRTGELCDQLASTNKTAVIKPPPLRPAVAGGFTLDDFELDDCAGTLTCPAGVTVTITTRRRAHSGASRSTCPLQRLCTNAKGGRVVVLHPHHRLLAAGRAEAATEEFDAVYRRWRPMVERSLAWLTGGSNRRLRYISVERNRMWWSHCCAPSSCGSIRAWRLADGHLIGTGILGCGPGTS